MPAMYSHVGIIIGAVVSAILGFYVFVPDGSLRMFDYWLSIWQPVVLDAPVVIRRTPFEEELTRYLEEAALEVAQIRYEDIIEEFRGQLQASSGILDPVIGPSQTPPQVDPYLLPFPISSLWVVAKAFFSVWPYFIFCLPIIALGRKTWELRKMQNRQREEKRDILEQLRQNIMENEEMAKAQEEQAQKILALDATTKILGESYKDLEAEHSNVKSEKKDLETQIRSLTRNAEELYTNHDAAQAEIFKLQGQLTSLQGESSKIKSAKGGLEQELNFLLDEAKQRDAELRQLQARSERIEKERDAALEKVRALKEASESLRELEERRKPQEAKKDQKNPIVEGGSSAPNSTTEGTATPHLDTAKDADEASEDGAEEIQDSVDTPKKAGKKKRRRRKHRGPGAGELEREQEEETHEKK